MDVAVSVSNDAPVLIDKFLDQATELDVDAVCDGKEVYIGSVMQHIEEAGIHSGDSACSLPPMNLSKEMIAQVEQQTKTIALGLGVVGLMNVQYADLPKRDLSYRGKPQSFPYGAFRNPKQRVCRLQKLRRAL